jgi:hypothetical protein
MTMLRDFTILIQYNHKLKLFSIKVTFNHINFINQTQINDEKYSCIQEDNNNH